MERKRKAKISLSKPKKKKLNETETKTEDNNAAILEKTNILVAAGGDSVDMNDKYPILKDEELVKKFMGVSMTNNQKGRIRQTVKAYVTGSSEDLVPQVLHDKMQEILNTQQPLNEASLRKLRILYNMLKTTIDKNSGDAGMKESKKKKKKNKSKNKKEISKEATTADSTNTENTEDTDNSIATVDKDAAKVKTDVKEINKVKGPKRYVVFVGNLPVDITEDKLKQHFANVSQHIQAVRIPVKGDNKKSSIAYVELKNEAAYELALSKHHSMLGNKRVNVLYTAQKNGKISKTEAKSKSAKLVALQKAGKLLGSVPRNKKRSHRRALLKAARAKENDALSNK